MWRDAVVSACRDMTAEIELLVAEKRRVEYAIQVNVYICMQALYQPAGPRMFFS